MLVMGCSELGQMLLGTHRGRLPWEAWRSGTSSKRCRCRCGQTTGHADDGLESHTQEKGEEIQIRLSCVESVGPVNEKLSEKLSENQKVIF